ncbi:MAG TPA: DUF4097 family beta strand repeat-containing protein [Povalibacter sp.]|nr:DUF4097 family beta strand repeat-containing protein [Povalibacter sp.]
MSFRASLACGLCLALLSTLTHAAEKRLDRTFTVQPGGKLTVDTDGSDITVRGTDSDQVTVHIVVTGSQSALDRLTLSAEPSAEGVAVTTRSSRHDWLDWLRSGGGRNAKISVSVPKRYQVGLKTSGGDLLIEQLEGTATGTTSGGDVRVGNVSGNVRMRTSGGNIVASDIGGDLHIKTSGGDITVRAVTGQLDAETSGGDIRMEQVHGPVRAHTSSGDIVADVIRSDADLDSSGGNIKASVDGRIRAATSGGNVDVELLGVNRGIEVSTSGGNILLHVPRNVAGVVDASTSGGSVVSDLPVTTVISSGGRVSRKLNGTINGGGEPIKARTSGGDIQLRARG